MKYIIYKFVSIDVNYFIFDSLCKFYKVFICQWIKNQFCCGVLVFKFVIKYYVEDVNFVGLLFFFLVEMCMILLIKVVNGVFEYFLFFMIIYQFLY